MKRGDVVVFKEPLAYEGKRALILRVSRRTGDFTVELVEDVSESIRKGQFFVVHPYTVRPAIETR